MKPPSELHLLVHYASTAPTWLSARLKEKRVIKIKSDYHDRSGHIDSKVKEEVVSFVSQLMNRTDYEVSVPV